MSRGDGGRVTEGYFVQIVEQVWLWLKEFCSAKNKQRYKLYIVPWILQVSSTCKYEGECSEFANSDLKGKSRFPNNTQSMVQLPD